MKHHEFQAAVHDNIEASSALSAAPRRKGNRRPSGLLSDISRLMTEDFRHLFWPILGWWLFLASVGYSIVRNESGDVSTNNQVFSRLLLAYLLGPMLAGLLVLRHQLGRRAWWRTRPWPHRHVLLAKLIGVAAFVWLPTAALQLVLVARADVQAPAWGIYLVELALTPGAGILAGAALACLCRSLFGLVIAFPVAAQLLSLARSDLLRQGSRSGDLYAVLEAVLIMTAALILLILSYHSISRKKALAMASLVLLGLVPAVSASWPEAFSPHPKVEAKLSPPESPGRAPSRSGDTSFLCIDFDLEGVLSRAGGDVANDIDMSFRGLPDKLTQAINPYSSIDAKRTGPNSARAESEPLASLPSSWLEDYSQMRGDLILTLTPSWRRDILDESPLDSGIRLSGLSSQGETISFAIAASDYVEGESTLALTVEKDPLLLHFLQPPRTRVFLDFEPLPPGSSALHKAALPGPTPMLPFSAQSLRGYRGIRELRLTDKPKAYGPEAVAASADPEAAFAAMRVLLVEQGQAASNTVVAILEDVALGDLVCKDSPG